MSRDMNVHGGKAAAKPKRTVAKQADVKAVASAKAKADAGSGAAMVTVGTGTAKHTIVSAEQLAATLGISGKRLRGWLRQGTVLGNDGRYSHYAIDVDSADGKALVAQAKARFIKAT